MKNTLLSVHYFELLLLILLQVNCNNAFSTLKDKADNEINLSFIAYNGVWNSFSLPFKIVDNKIPTFQLINPLENVKLTEDGTLLWKPLATLLKPSLFEVFMKIQNKTTLFNLQIKVAPLKRVMLVVAHQDDEIGMAYSLKKFIEAKADFYSLWLAGSDRESTERDEMCEIRKNESTNAMKSYQIPANHLFFLCYPDRDIGPNLKELYNKTFNIIKNVNPEIIMLAAFEGGHMDHDLTNFLVHYIVKKQKLNIALFEYPLYSRKGMDPINAFQFIPGATTLINLTKDFSTIYDFSKFYPSQEKIINTLISYAKLNKITNPFVQIRAMPNWDYLKPPSSRPLGYETNIFLPGNKFKKFHKEYEQQVSTFLNKSSEAIFNPDRPSEQILEDFVEATEIKNY